MAKRLAAEPAHALLSASSSHRWLTCTPSVRLEEDFPDTTSDYAAEGSLAHEIGELKLRKQFLEPMTTAKFKSRMKKLQDNPLYTSEMQHYTDEYLDYVSSVVHSFDAPPSIALEKRLDYSFYAPEGFGTGDCILVGGDTLYVIDFKYGRGVPVSAEENTQLKLYALGAYREYNLIYTIRQIKLVIVQPRIDNISEYALSMEKLLLWGQEIKPVAKKAFAGEGEFVAGEHCRFCRAKSLCRARADFNIEIEPEKAKLPPLITDDEVGDLLTRARDLAKWAKDLEEYALTACLDGVVIPGWKAVEGRSNRKFTDIDQAFQVLTAAGTPEVALYERKPLSLTGVEELVGKSTFRELLADYLEKPPGKPTLAPISDGREAIANKVTPQEAFKEEEIHESK